jgi:hypothetical protein
MFGDVVTDSCWLPLAGSFPGVNWAGTVACSKWRSLVSVGSALDLKKSCHIIHFLGIFLDEPNP